MITIRSSSVVEQSAVNRSVVGSNPTCGANLESCPSWSKEHDWKSCRRLKAVSRVRIPHSPPVKVAWPVGQVVKTPPFHGGNTGSNPVRVTIFYFKILIQWRISSAGRAPALQARGRRFDPVILHHINNVVGWSNKHYIPE